MASVFGASSAALRKVIANPLARFRRGEEDGTHGEDAGKSSISAIIEGEIIPQLLSAHADDRPVPQRDTGKRIDPEEASRFSTMPLSKDASALLDEIDALLATGVTLEAIYIDLLAPSARKLGEMWEEDECDFVDVTMGLWRLQEVMRDIAARTPHMSSGGEGPRRALFASMPGDQHTFGTIIIEDVFARNGWNTEILIQPERRELLDNVAHKSFDLVGLTISRDCPSAAISQLITAIRGVSINSQIKVLIGGRMINENPSLVHEVSADAMAFDARDALAVAGKLVEAQQIAPETR